MITPEISEKLSLLSAKYEAMGQDINSYLDGLLYADYLTYWHYIHLDTLLTLQTPRTSFEDESIFIMYHQITELNFKLVLHAMRQICDAMPLQTAEFVKQLQRMNSYFKMLINSFEIMIDGMDKEQFLRFRMALLPASGFQSAQYRMIELFATDIDKLIAKQHRDQINYDNEIAAILPYLYWKQGANELATGKKTLTLRQFELKYDEEFIRIINDHKHKNLYARYRTLSDEEQKNEELIAQMRLFDHQANVMWPLMHYRSAVRYLNRNPNVIAATGGSNWQKYLPPQHQHIIFFPELWTQEEKNEWGKKTEINQLPK